MAMSTGRGGFILWDVDAQSVGADMMARLKRIEERLLTTAPLALEEASKPVIQMMQHLAPEDTGALRKSIKFTLGNRGGEARSQLPRRGQGVKKTSVVAYITAGDDTTLVGGSPAAGYTEDVKVGRRKFKRVARKRGKRMQRQWQNARLQEFGTQKMKAHPFFFPAWRASKKSFQRAVKQQLKAAFAASQIGPAQPAKAA